MTRDLAVVLVRELEGLQREVEMFPDDESVWQTLPGVANSAGNIALHIAGNLQHFVGAVLGGTGYTRDRDVEFGRRSGTRAELATELARAIQVVGDVLPRVSDEQLDAPFAAAPMSQPVSTRRFLLHLCAHTAYHLGQAGYLRRMLTGDSRPSQALSVFRLI